MVIIAFLFEQNLGIEEVYYCLTFVLFPSIQFSGQRQFIKKYTMDLQMLTTASAHNMYV